ncbi:unnamed protein product [Acanthoscelides obtectus]|uniref:Uncharacterized protein n=1 Tax=Acanthoscelides obtectus TaxID=200917 RepID=A0A9P0KZZ1_ACAOB|nr:unnamed protein product [Acanthoscelides obtectus]CAK1635868.1 hypothetical protein AOBTE_LOCUS9578 [Acanthoscelides obtectus]
MLVVLTSFESSKRVTPKRQKMISDDPSSKKCALKSKITPLRRSVSTTSIGGLFTAHLNLRDTRSYAGGMDDTRSTNSDDEGVELDKNVTEERNRCPEGKDEVETRDAVTNKVFLVKKEDLQQHTLNEVAYLWKKDCRIWLWKNCAELKSNKSVAEKLKTGITELRQCTF